MARSKKAKAGAKGGKSRPALKKNRKRSPQPGFLAGRKKKKK